jgi:hypothetical protein
LFFAFFFGFFSLPRRSSNHNFLLVLTDFALVENEKGIGGARRPLSHDSGHDNQRPVGK